MKVILEGKWVVEGTKVVADAKCKEIEGVLKASFKVAARDAGWTTLHRTSDGTLWELSFPQGELQGGGPPRLESLSPSEAETRYGSYETKST